MATKTLQELIIELLGGQEDEGFGAPRPINPDILAPQQEQSYLDYEAQTRGAPGAPAAPQGKMGALLQLLPMILAPTVGAAVGGGRGALAASAGLGRGMVENQRYQELMAQRQKEDDLAARMKISDMFERRRAEAERNRTLKEIKEADLQAELAREDRVAKRQEKLKGIDLLIKAAEQEEKNQRFYVTEQGPVATEDYNAALHGKLILTQPQSYDEAGRLFRDMPVKPTSLEEKNKQIEGFIGKTTTPQQKEHIAGIAPQYNPQTEALREQMKEERAFDRAVRMHENVEDRLKGFRSWQKMFSRVQIATTKQGTVRDDMLIMSWNKMQDENSVVRESEYLRTRQFGSLKQKVEAHIRSLKSGEMIHPDIRKEMIDAMTEYNTEQRKQARELQEEYRSIAQKGKLDADIVVPELIEIDVKPGQAKRNADGTITIY